MPKIPHVAFCLLVAFATAHSSIAQTSLAPGTDQQQIAVSPTGPFTTTPEIAPVALNPNKPNFTAEFGFSYLNTQFDLTTNHGLTKTTGNLSYFGGTAAFGWRINRFYKLQVDIGTLAATRHKVDYLSVPVMLSYSIYIPLGQSPNWELCVSPTVGAYYTSAKFDDFYAGSDTDYSYYVYNTERTISLAAGAGASLAYHINNRWYVNVGYRFIHVSSAGGTYVSFGNQNAHNVNLTAGIKF